MSLKINIILIFLSCSTFGLGESISRKKSDSGHYHCYVEAPVVDTSFAPIPFEGNFTKTETFAFHDVIGTLDPAPSKPTIIRPDKNGYYLFNHNSTYKFSCTKHEFMPPIPHPVSEVTVKCSNGTFVYKGNVYKFNQFRCSGMPKSRFIATQKSCQGGDYTEVIKVGLQSRDTFIDLYRICFDSWHKNTLYAWHFMDPRSYIYNQITNVTYDYIRTKSYGPVEPDEAYADQRKTLKTIFQHENIDDVYKKNYTEINAFISPDHLVSEQEFYSVAEQYSTFYYENTAPAWFTFAREVWHNVQSAFRNDLSKINSRHLVITGTILTNPHYHNIYDHEFHEMYLISPNSLTVPEYFWKMDYDLERKSGTVVIAVNSPFKTLDPKVHICNPIPCPGHSMSNLEKRTKLVFCCTKESFEKVYGVIDPVVFKEF